MACQIWNKRLSTMLNLAIIPLVMTFFLISGLGALDIIIPEGIIFANLLAGFSTGLIYQHLLNTYAYSTNEGPNLAQ